MRLIDCDALKKDWSMADRCEDCPQKVIACQYDQVFTRMDICQMLDDAPTVGEWISVEDRLPKSNEVVLVCVYDKDGQLDCQTIAVRYPCGDWDSVDDYFNQCDGDVRYWMPLPKPPEAPHDAP